MNFSETISSVKAAFGDKDFQSLIKRWLKLNRWGIMLIIFLSSFFLTFYVANVMNVNNTLNDLRQMKKYHENLINKNKLLLSRIEALESPERIDYIAVQKLGMIRAEKAPTILRVKK